MAPFMRVYLLNYPVIALVRSIRKCYSFLTIREHRMNITLDQAIVIYARASRSWFGEKAKFKTQERIQQLAAQGDNEGVDVHERVRLNIMRLEAPSAEPGSVAS